MGNQVDARRQIGANLLKARADGLGNIQGRLVADPVNIDENGRMPVVAGKIVRFFKPVIDVGDIRQEHLSATHWW